ncbi:amidase signature domain-containing protein [Apodospora peruviana]|uniref:Amidase signature domain-containing protein n=1 Tax=Apodospora peruviana TaxID=516989 RepID=A0AAE0I059_9PEZI|nr:amidase signature domain-containing protein [Apodospora peruviana]
MGSVSPARKLLNRIEPLEGPDVPYVVDRKSNPPLRGILLIAAAFLMERFRFIREKIWHNAGFGSLRKIIPHIEDYEPLFEPQILPLPEEPDGSTNDDTNGASASPQDDDNEIVEIKSDPDTTKPKYPETKYYSVQDYRELFLSGALTPLEVAETLLPLIRRDVQNPTAHSEAFFETKVEKVLAAARASTQRYKEKGSLGPLDGVPTAVKDEYDIDGYSTSLGSKNTYTGTIREDDCNTTWCVRKLEAAGAVILGKLSMHEFGLDTTGNNPVHGTPRNPHNSKYYTGGSSSGTGYCVASGLIPIGLGSDGGGSIRIPASLCGVFGLKPTHGRLSFKPGQNHCITCACLGPLAADVKSLAAVFQVISEPHPTSQFPRLPPLRLIAKPNAPKVLGIPRAWVRRATPGIQTLFEQMVQRLFIDQDYEVVDIKIPFLAEGQIAHAMTVLADAATLLPDTKNLTAANRILLAIGRVTPVTDYLLAQKLRRALMQHLAWLWKQYPGMLIVTPTTACEGLPIRDEKAELKYGVNDGDRTLESMEFVWLANFCGLPSISVPMGFVPAVKGSGDVPVGLMATGEWCSEEELLQFGGVAEEVGAQERRRPPNWVDVVEETVSGKRDNNVAVAAAAAGRQD